MKNILLMIVLSFVVQLSFGQEFKGKILDVETKEGIPFANIYIKDVQVNAMLAMFLFINHTTLW